jgi:hypothetical protein
MAPWTNATRKIGLHDLVEDILILILVESDVPGVLALGRVSLHSDPTDCSHSSPDQ